MPLEGRRRQMVEQSRETPAARRSGETVDTKLLRIAAKAQQERQLAKPAQPATELHVGRIPRLAAAVPVAATARARLLILSARE